VNELRERGEPRREGRIWARGKRGILWIQWYDAQGEQRRATTESTDPRVADRMLRDKLAEKERGERHVPRARRATVGDLLNGLRDYHEERATKSRDRIEQSAAHIREHFGDDARAGDITFAALEQYVRARHGQQAAASTIRNELAVFKQAFKVARKRALVASAPEFPTVTVRNTRTACFDDEQLEKLLKALPSPVRAVAAFGSMTGWRLEECLGLKWERVDFENRLVRLEASETKGRAARVLPFGTFPALAALLEAQRQERWRIERERGVQVERVFTRAGRPIKDLDDAWHAACRKAGLVDRRFHDLRRYAAARLAKAGVSPAVAMQALGHKTLSMWLRYSIADTSALEQALAKVAALAK
jgi:integrase